MAYRLSTHAESDLLELFAQGARRFGVAQADRYYAGLTRVFDLLARFPMLARERNEIIAPVHIHAYRAHVIVYEVAAGHVVILRVRHGREDWASSPLGD